MTCEQGGTNAPAGGRQPVVPPRCNCRPDYNACHHQTRDSNALCVRVTLSWAHLFSLRLIVTTSSRSLSRASSVRSARSSDACDDSTIFKLASTSWLRCAATWVQRCFLDSAAVFTVWHTVWPARRARVADMDMSANASSQCKRLPACATPLQLQVLLL